MLRPGKITKVKKIDQKKKKKKYFYKIIYKGNNAKPIQKALKDRLNWEPVNIA